MAFASFFKHRSIHLCIVFSSEQYHADLCTMLIQDLITSSVSIPRLSTKPISPSPTPSTTTTCVRPISAPYPDDTLSRTRLPAALHHRTTQGARLHTHTAWLPWCTAWRLLGLLAGCWAESAGDGACGLGAMCVCSCCCFWGEGWGGGGVYTGMVC